MGRWEGRTFCAKGSICLRTQTRMMPQCIPSITAVEEGRGLEHPERQVRPERQIGSGLDWAWESNLRILNFILKIMKVNVKVTQLCPTLCDPMGYTVNGILQARTLEWVALPFSRGSSQPRD